METQIGMFQSVYINGTCIQSSSKNLKALYKSLSKKANPIRQSLSE